MAMIPSTTRTRRRVLDVLRQHGSLSQTEIAGRAGLSRTTVAALTPALEREGLIRREGERREHPGRPQPLFRLDENAAFIVGVVFGTRHLRAGIGNLDCRLVPTRRGADGGAQAEPVAVPALARAGAGPALEAAAEVVERLLEEGGIDRRRVIGVGLGLSGPLDRRGTSATVASERILPGWSDIDPAAVLSRHLQGLPVEVENDANLSALGEAVRGAGRDHESMVYVKAGHGIGCGIVHNGELWRGAFGTAGELGHVIVDPSGPPDSSGCGRKGCLEALAGGRAISEDVRERIGAYLSLREVIDRAVDDRAVAAEDRMALVCRSALERAGWQIGMAVAGLCTLLNPRCIVLGGGLAAAQAVVLPAVRQSLLSHVLECSTPSLVVGGTLGNRAELVGAWAHLLRSERSLSHLDEILGASGAAPRGVPMAE
jgi:predicted NBD/HSP70 family sugar kinase